MKLTVLAAAVVGSGFALFAGSANAGVTTDHHGNVGYDSYDECVAAVKDGSAKFYTPYTHQQPKRMAGETSVKKMTLSDLTIPSNIAAQMPVNTSDYSAGACDKGVGQSNGRYGVSGALVGKYVPFAPDMPINVYMNSNNEVVRVTMQQCDNHFGGKFPTPVVSEIKAPKPQVAIQEERRVEPVTTEVKRVIRPTKYRVKEVIVAPEDQVNRVNTETGTAVTVEGEAQTVYLGNQVDPAILNEVEVNQPVPVITVPDDDSE